VAPWLAWHLALPFVQFSLIVWSIIQLFKCDGLGVTEVKTLAAIVLSIYAVSFGEYILLYVNFLSAAMKLINFKRYCSNSLPPPPLPVHVLTIPPFNMRKITREDTPFPSVLPRQNGTGIITSKHIRLSNSMEERPSSPFKSDFKKLSHYRDCETFVP
jgi:hypothetical protein